MPTMRRDLPAIRPVFRVLAGILGPAMMFVGVVGPAAIVWSLIRGGGEEWMEMTIIACAAAAGVPYGLRFLQAARTGRDPYGRAADDDLPG
jgi:hypothetical protein